MFKRLTFLFLVSFSLYGMNKKKKHKEGVPKVQIEQAVEKKSVFGPRDAEGTLESFAPQLTFSERRRLEERLQEVTGEKLNSLDFYHLYTDKNSFGKHVPGFHIARTAEAKNSLTGIYKFLDGSYSGKVGKDKKYSTFFPDDLTDDELVDCIGTVMRPSIKGKNLRRGRKDNQYPSGESYDGKCTIRGKSLNVRVVREGSRVKTFFPLGASSTSVTCSKKYK